MLTTATLAPKRYIARNKKTGLYLGREGLGFTEHLKELSPKLSETELLIVRHVWNNVEREVVS